MTDEVADQAPEQSAMEKIASKFGFPSGEQPVESTDSPVTDADLAEVEYEGAKYQVPSKIKDAIMRQSDYTQKTQELADQRRSLEQARELTIQRQLDASFSDTIKDEAKQLDMIDAYLSQVGKTDWQNMSTDQLLRQKIEIDGLKEQRAALKQAIEGKRNNFNNDFQAKLKELRGKSREIASKSIPNFSEDTEKEIRAYAVSKGLTDSEFDNVALDPRSLQILADAAQFAKVKANTGKATESATKAAKVLKPGAASERMPQDVRAKLDLGKALKTAQSSRDKANAIEAWLAPKFERSA